MRHKRPHRLASGLLDPRFRADDDRGSSDLGRRNESFGNTAGIIPRERGLTVSEALHSFRIDIRGRRMRFSNQRCSMGVGKVSDATFEAEVLKSTQPVVVDFWAEWCGPCRMIAPALEEISGTLGEKVKILKLNVDENPTTASKYGVMSIPTLMLFKNGELASRQVGAAPKQKLEQWITGAA
jgi:thioredoxin 1